MLNLYLFFKKIYLTLKNIPNIIKYRKNEWVNITEINDVDICIRVFRQHNTNFIGVEVFDKDLKKEQMYLRSRSFHYGDLKYANVPGFSPSFECPECEAMENVDLDQIIEQQENNS